MKKGAAAALAFAELRHAAAVVRAAQAAASLSEFEVAFGAAYAAWRETRRRTEVQLRDHHVAEVERLHVRSRASCVRATKRLLWPDACVHSPCRNKARFAADDAQAVRTCPTASALRREQQALLGARQFVQAFEHLKLVKAAEAKVSASAWLRAPTVVLTRAVCIGYFQAPSARRGGKRAGVVRAAGGAHSRACSCRSALHKCWVVSSVRKY